MCRPERSPGAGCSAPATSAEGDQSLMNRRHFINSVIGAGAALPLWQTAAARSRPAAPDSRRLAVPSADQSAWQDLEIGMFTHFAPNTWQDREYDDLSTPLSAINPAQLDTDQWAECAEGLGAKYIVFVAKHVGGFCAWQTETTDYSIRNTPWRGGKGRCHGRFGRVLPQAWPETRGLPFSSRRQVRRGHGRALQDSRAAERRTTRSIAAN